MILPPKAGGDFAGQQNIRFRMSMTKLDTSPLLLGYLLVLTDSLEC